MKKSDELRIKTRKLLAKNLIILVVLAVVAIVGAFSWFTDRTSAKAEGVSITTQANNALEFFIRDPSAATGTLQAQYNAVNAFITQHNGDPNNVDDQIGWHNGSVDFDFAADEEDFSSEFKFMKELFLGEVTSNGITFNSPSLNQSGDHALVDENAAAAYEAATMNQDYLSFDVFFRCRERYEIVLKYNSNIEPIDKSKLSVEHDYGPDDVGYENDIKPAAIGAVRLSVLTDNNTPELLWIPGPNVWFNGLTEHLYTGLSSNGSGNYSYGPNKGSVYLSSGSPAIRTGIYTTDHTYYIKANAGSAPEFKRMTTDSSSQDYTDYLRASTNGNYQLGANSSEDVSVCTLSASTVTDSIDGEPYYIGRIRVNLWIEGEDSEARLALVNGMFNMGLNFDIKEI